MGSGQNFRAAGSTAKLTQIHVIIQWRKTSVLYVSCCNGPRQNDRMAHYDETAISPWPRHFVQKYRKPFRLEFVIHSRCFLDVVLLWSVVDRWLSWWWVSRKPKDWTRFFLCHQKIAAGSMARLLKIELQKRGSKFTTFATWIDLARH